MADNSPRQARRQQAELPQSLTPQPKLGSANQAGAVVAEARQAQLELTPAELPAVEVVDGPVDGTTVTAEPRQQEEQQVSAEQLAPLQAQVDAAKRQSEEQYRARVEADRKTREAQVQTADANRMAIENGLLAARSKADQAEAQLADAHARADAPAIAKATRALTSADREIGVFESQKTQWDAYVAQVKAQPQAQAVSPTQTESMDVGGRQVDLSEYTPSERKWIRANPEFMTDAAFNQLASTAAKMALGQGYTRDSQEYIDYIASQTQAAKPQRQEPKMESKKTVSAAAPVSRSASPQAQHGVKLYLSSSAVPDTNGLSEAEAALISYPDLPKAEAYQRYAQDMDAMIKEGHPGMTAAIQRRSA